MIGGGEIGALIAAHDWSTTPLGPIEQWPQSLRTMLGFLLGSPVPMVMLWGEAGVMLYNDGCSVFAGGRHPKQIGMPVREGWPEVADFNDNVMKVGLAGGTLAYKDQELTLHRHGSPEQVWMNLDYSPVLDDSGRPAGVLAIVIETTERVAAERALRDERDRSRGVLDNMGDAFALLDSEFRIVEMNAAAWCLESRPRAEVIGKTHWEALPDAAPEVGDLYRRGMTDQLPVMLEHRYVWSDGRESWIDMRANPVREGLAVFYRVISDRKRDEAAVAESETRFRNMADQAPVMMWITDPSGYCSYLNRRWYEFTGQQVGAAARAMAGSTRSTATIGPWRRPHSALRTPSRRTTASSSAFGVPLGPIDGRSMRRPPGSRPTARVWAMWVRSRPARLERSPARRRRAGTSA